MPMNYVLPGGYQDIAPDPYAGINVDDMSSAAIAMGLTPAAMASSTKKYIPPKPAGAAPGQEGPPGAGPAKKNPLLDALQGEMMGPGNLSMG